MGRTRTARTTRGSERTEGRTNSSGQLSTEVVHARLRDGILRGEFDPHVPISQVQLAARLGVSRTPLREALRMLQREGLIDSEPNRRVRVAALSVTDLEQLYASRVVLEALALRLSISYFTQDDLRDMGSCMEQMAERADDRDLDSWELAHRTYHDLLRKHAGDRIQRIARNLSDHTERYRRVYLAEPRAWSAAAKEHMAVLDACRNGNGVIASQQLARHLARTALTLIALASPEHDPAPVREALRLATADAEVMADMEGGA